MKKVFSCILSLIMAFAITVPAFAAEQDVEGKSQEEIRATIVDIVASASSKEERDRMLTTLLQETPLAPTVPVNSIHAGRDVHEEKVYVGMPQITESVKINENKRVDFYETGDFGIYEVENLGPTDVPMAYASSYSYTNTYRTSYTIENLLGGKIVETYVKGYFRFDGTNTPTAYLEDAGYSKGTLVFWDCSSWKEGTKTNSRDKSAYCYADAYYDWTIDVSLKGSVSGGIGGVEGEVSGEISDGLTIQDCNVYLRLICSKAGNVTGAVSVEG